MVCVTAFKPALSTPTAGECNTASIRPAVVPRAPFRVIASATATEYGEHTTLPGVWANLRKRSQLNALTAWTVAGSAWSEPRRLATSAPTNPAAPIEPGPTAPLDDCSAH